MFNNDILTVKQIEFAIAMAGNDQHIRVYLPRNDWRNKVFTHLRSMIKKKKKINPRYLQI